MWHVRSSQTGSVPYRGRFLILSVGPSGHSRHMNGPLPARHGQTSLDLTRRWPLLLLVLFSLAILAARVPLDPVRQQQSQFIERCTDAFSADNFTPARLALGLPTISSGGFRILNTHLTTVAGVQRAVFPARLLGPSGELFRTFVCLETKPSVTFRLARPEDVPQSSPY